MAGKCKKTTGNSSFQNLQSIVKRCNQNALGILASAGTVQELEDEVGDAEPTTELKPGSSLQGVWWGREFSSNA